MTVYTQISRQASSGKRYRDIEDTDVNARGNAELSLLRRFELKKIFFIHLALITLVFSSANAQVEKLSTTSSSPKILSRQEWKAKDAIGEMKQHIIRHITIHHTASPQKEKITIEKKMQSLQNFSQSESRLASGKHKPVWADVPYHYYIAVDGQIAEGRDIRYAGDTNTDYDPSGHALIVLEGNFENELPTIKQLESLRELVNWLSVNYEIPVSEIKAHNDYAATACPGINLKKLLPTLKQKVTQSIRR